MGTSLVPARAFQRRASFRTSRPFLSCHSTSTSPGHFWPGLFLYLRSGCVDPPETGEQRRRAAKAYRVEVLNASFPLFIYRIMSKSWRDTARPIIHRVLEETRGQDPRLIREALRKAYPFGQRSLHPYKVWLDEIKVQQKKRTFGRRPDLHNPDQGTLF